MDTAFPWTCLLCSFQGSLSVWQLTGSEWLYWFFFLCFIIQALLALLLFFSLLLCCARVAWAVWFSSICFAAAAVKVGQEAAVLRRNGWVQRNPQTSCGDSPEDEKKIRWWNWGKIEVSICFIRGSMTQSDRPLTFLAPVAGIHFSVSFHLLLCLKLCK